jgi:APA family basic amino acid/polyamine antiporter
MPAAVATDGLAPRMLAKKNAGHAPTRALLISSCVATLLLVFNYNEGLVAAFTFLISMSTLATLMPYALSALAELKHSKLQFGPWLIIAIVALAYSLIAMAGAGVTTLLWGLLMIVAGLPLFYWSRRN